MIGGVQRGRITRHRKVPWAELHGFGCAPAWPSMAVHVNIGDAKTCLSELLRAVQAGERVIIQRDGRPEAEIIPVPDTPPLTREQIAAKRRAAFGMYREAFKGSDLSLEAREAGRIDPDESGRKCAPPA